MITYGKPGGKLPTLVSSALKCGVSSAALMTATLSVQAQDSNLAIEEIMVTAQKRSQSTRDVPIAISAFDANFTKRTNLDDVKDLIKFAPGLAGDSKDSFIDLVNVRGITTNDFGVGGDPSVAFFKNGLYQGRNGAVVTSMFDMDRAEVLRGPQGFLFGRNAIGGAISVFTAKPDHDTSGGYVEAGFGERGIMEFEGAVNLPFAERWALRLSGYHSEEDGYVDNFARPDDDRLIAHNKSAIRGTLSYKGESLDGFVMVEYENRKQSGSVYRAIVDDEIFPFLEENVEGTQLRGNDRDIDSDFSLGNFDNGELFAISGELNFDVGFATLTSLTGYKGHTYDYAEDYDGLPVGINGYEQDQDGYYFEQELRLVGNSEGPLSWYAGVSYYKENIDALFTQRIDEEVICNAYYYYSCADLFAYWEYPEFTASPNQLTESNRDRGDYQGWGAYVDVNYAVSDQLELGVGLRYSRDEKDFKINILPVDSELGPFYIFGVTTDGFVEGSDSWDDLSPRFVARYRPNEEWTIYGSVTKGYKSGGFGSFAIVLGSDGVDDDAVAQPGATPNTFDPETVWSYELGTKADLFDSRLRLDLASYYYRYTDLQLSFFDSGSRVANIGKVTAYGLEATVQAIVTENIDLYLAGSFNENEITGADQVAEDSDGNRLGDSPKWTLAGVVSYHTPITETGELTASLDFRAQTGSFGGVENIIAARNDGWTDVSARLGYQDEAGWGVVAYVENVFNAVYFDATNEGGAVQPHHAFGVSRPRTVGVRLNYRFGE
jgi:iron complex outermembrane receptor protein